MALYLLATVAKLHLVSYFKLFLKGSPVTNLINPLMRSDADWEQYMPVPDCMKKVSGGFDRDSKVSKRLLDLQNFETNHVCAHTQTLPASVHLPSAA